jgi:hypothetical protein
MGIIMVEQYTFFTEPESQQYVQEDFCMIFCEEMIPPPLRHVQVNFLCDLNFGDPFPLQMCSLQVELVQNPERCESEEEDFLLFQLLHE